jgi:S1-C subfamily serine protease
MASDKTNDLALLKADHRPAKVEAIRLGIRLGEPVAAFGFPLSSVLATTGNDAALFRASAESCRSELTWEIKA